MLIDCDETLLRSLTSLRTQILIVFSVDRPNVFAEVSRRPEICKFFHSHQVNGFSLRKVNRVDSTVLIFFGMCYDFSRQ